MSLTELISANSIRWSRCSLNADRAAEFGSVASRLCAAKQRYVAVSAKTSVPWFVIAVIHEREATQSWAANLGQGDPWNKVSTHVPKGRGPFASWDDAAIDALTNCAPYAARWKDWGAGGTLTLLEQYNGLGYAAHGVPSPYVWSGTNQYTIGKIVVDHGPIEPIVDKQLGCAGLIRAMQKLDPLISFGAPAISIPAPQDIPKPKPPVPSPAQQPSLIAQIINLILSLFTKPKGK